MGAKIINFVTKIKKIVFTKFRHQNLKIAHKYKNLSPNYNSNSDLKIMFPIKFYPCSVKISSSNSFFISPTNF